MLFKLAGADMLNTALIDVATGVRAYNIATVLSPITEEFEQAQSTLPHPSSSSCQSSSATQSSFIKTDPVSNSHELKAPRRATTVTDASGKQVAHIEWIGRCPNLSIGDEKVGALTDLFGTSTVRFMPKVLAIPTRFDTEYIWTATADSLVLYDYDTESVKGCFHQNTIKIPSGTKTLKRKSSSGTSSKFRQTSPADVVSSSPPSPSSSSVSSLGAKSFCQSTELGRHTFIPTRVPGLGSCYLEFDSHPLAQDIEIILSFLMMEIVRRGRFSLTPYTFKRPKLWQLKEAGDLVMRRFRRNTV